MTISNPTIEKLIPNWVDLHVEALEDNYRKHHIEMHTRPSIGFSQEYANTVLEEVRNGTAKLKRFRAITGKKYYKVVSMDWDENRKEYRDQSVTCFIDKKTGEIYKPASWKSPAKHVRYDMRIISQRERMHNSKFTDWAGGYLYLR